MYNFTLLYVEDDVVSQKMMKMMLEDEVKELYQAFNGAEGLEIYKKHKPDVILTDINMPILNGLDMSKEIKKIDKKQPIFVLSAFSDREILLNSINIGIDHFIPKPIDMDNLMEKLAEIEISLQEKLDKQKDKDKEIEKLYNLAHYDSLTKVYNRFFFIKKLKETVLMAQENNDIFSLLFIDLDDFKMINDTYGHAAGDKVLKSVANNINSIIGKKDVFSRLGGDEFALIVDNVNDKKTLNELADKILKEIAKDIEFEGDVFNISASIGISRFAIDADTESTLLHSADTAMYKAKKLGKSAYCYV